MNNKVLNFHRWFPTVIGVTECPFINEVQQEYKDYLNIKDNEPQGYQYHQLHKDERFKRLFDWQQEQVNTFTEAHSWKEMKPGESWYIDYQPYTNNHWHKHLGWAVSTVFVLDADPMDSPTCFRSPLYGDAILTRTQEEKKILNPIEIEEAERFNEFTYPTCEYKPLTGQLLIFKSSVEHMIDNKSPDLGPRVIFSTNYRSI